MLLIADSGSTKTNWSLVEKGKVRSFQTHGMNPYFLNREQATSIIRNELPASLTRQSRVEHIFFYGAGCNGNAKNKIIRDALSTVFRKAHSHVNSDLLGAAFGLCGENPGIVAVLGTGSNCAYFDGTSMQQRSSSLGFILGDEGGGANLGKRFIRAYLYSKLPVSISKSFERKFSFRKEALLDAIYKKEFPNRFLASFVPFIKSQQQSAFIRQLVYESFSEFFENHVSNYRSEYMKGLVITGSVGFIFKDILNKVSRENKLELKKVVRDPLPGLVKYHSALLKK